MACFLVPAAEAIVTTIAAKAVKSHELKTDKKTGLSQKLNRLSGFLWGGSALLAFEHLWHGEITPWFPFLTNVSSPENISAMLYEMATVGTSMAALVTVVWAAVTVISSRIEKRKPNLIKAEGDTV